MSDPDPPQDAAHGPWPPGWHVREVAETGSTNTDLLAVATTAPHRTVLRTDHQTAGRGRLDRRWDAPPGTNLLVSILFRDVPDDPGELTRRVGLAIVDAAREIAGVEAVLKWPNDVLVGGAKLAGILAQRAATGEVVVGTGINVGWAPEGAARLADPGAEGLTPRAMLAALLGAFDALPGDVTERYRAALDTVGRRVRVIRASDEFTGRAVDVDSDGRLVVIDDCALTHRIDAGDVVHLRPDDAG